MKSLSWYLDLKPWGVGGPFWGHFVFYFPPPIRHKKVKAHILAGPNRAEIFAISKMVYLDKFGPKEGKLSPLQLFLG